MKSDSSRPVVALSRRHCYLAMCGVALAILVFHSLTLDTLSQNGRLLLAVAMLGPAASLLGGNDYGPVMLVLLVSLLGMFGPGLGPMTFVVTSATLLYSIAHYRYARLLAQEAEFPEVRSPREELVDEMLKLVALLPVHPIIAWVTWDFLHNVVPLVEIEVYFDVVPQIARFAVGIVAVAAFAGAIRAMMSVLGEGAWSPLESRAYLNDLVWRELRPELDEAGRRIGRRRSKRKGR